MIVAASLTKKYGNTVAVNGLSFKAKDGEIIGFLGPNGAGKTTTMRLLLGYLRADQGSVMVNRFSPVAHRIDLLQNTGYLAENNPLYQEMKVGEYLQFINDIKSGAGFEEIADSVGISDVYGKKIEELSRGYRQRVGLAAALIGNPDVLILDEPTSGLDPLEQEKIRNLIKKIAVKKTVIFSTHILSEAESIANRLIIINRGKVVYDGAKPKGRGAVEKLFKKLVK